MRRLVEQIATAGAVHSSGPKPKRCWFASNKYSVKASAVGRLVEVHACADRIVIRGTGLSSLSTTGALAETRRPLPPGYVPVLARKPGALRNGAPFKDWVLPSAMEKIRRKGKDPPQARGVC
jgi:hypothetical protein